MGLLAPGHHVDREAENALSFDQKLGPVARFAQRLGRDRAHMMLLEPCQPLAEACQAVPAALHGCRSQVAIIVQAAALAHGLFQVFGPVDLTVVKVADFKAEAVGSQVHSGEAGTVLHE